MLATKLVIAKHDGEKLLRDGHDDDNSATAGTKTMVIKWFRFSKE
jgi:hypothetical protein